MTEKMGYVAAIKKFMERKDQFAPEGGRPVPMAELQALSVEDRKALGALCAKELGVEISS